MFTKNTVLILGAGASCEYGYPTGNGLVQDIVSKYSDDTLDAGIEEYKIIGIPEYKDFIQMMERVEPSNIDLFLKNNPALAKEGKALIAYAMRSCEYYNKTTHKLTRTGGEGWYKNITNHLLKGLNDSQAIFDNKLSVITFNYDVSLEAYLTLNLRTNGLSSSVADEFLNKLEIIHVYGQLYKLDWHKDGGNPIDFYAGKTPSVIRDGTEKNKANAERFFEAKDPLSNNLHVIGEKKQEELYQSPHIIRAQELISNADIIYFLGFGFDPDNLGLLDFPAVLTREANPKEIFYTNPEGSKIIDRTVQKLIGKAEHTNKFITESFDTDFAFE